MKIVRGRTDGTPTQQRGETFTGVVWADPVLPSTDGTMVNSVTFTPGARTFWHSHEHGQLLIVTAGGGWVCVDGGEPDSGPVAADELSRRAPRSRCRCCR